MEIKFGLSWDIYYHFTKFHNREKILQKAVIYGFAGLLLLNFLAFRTFRWENYLTLSGFLVVTLSGVIGALSWTLSRVFLFWNSKRGFEKMKLGQENWHFVATKERLELKGDTPFRMNWEDLYGVRESPLAWFLYVDPKRAYLIPKTAFEGEQLEAWTRLIQERVRPPRYKVLKS